MSKPARLTRSTRKFSVHRHCRLESLERREMMAADTGYTSHQDVQDRIDLPVVVIPVDDGQQHDDSVVGQRPTEIEQNQFFLPPDLDDDGTLHISGRSVGDYIVINANYGAGQVAVQISDIGPGSSDPVIDQTFDLDAVERIIVHAGGGVNTVYNNTNIPAELHGGSQDDVLVGGGARDDLFGYGGEDRLYGRGGDDWLYGGEEGDELYGDRDEAGNTTTTGDDHLFGEEGEDILQGNNGNDELVGGDDDDFLFGHQGSDRLDGGFGDDYLFGSEPSSNWDEPVGVVYGFLGNEDDTLIGGVGNDMLSGGGGADWLYGRFEETTTSGPVLFSEDADVLMGEAGDDHLFGGIDADVLMGGAGGDELDGNEGDDKLYGEDDQPGPHSGAGDDTLRGGSGDDILRGNEGADTLNGGGGKDSLFGGQGVDTLDGGADSVVDRLLVWADQAGSDGSDTNDIVQNVQSSDAVITFEDGVEMEESFYGIADPVEHTAASWSIAEIEMADEVFQVLVDRTGNERLLKTKTGVQLTFRRHGTTTYDDGNPDAWNYGNGTIVVLDSAYNVVSADIFSGGGTPTAANEAQAKLWRDSYARQNIFHELAHNWDDGNENALIDQFRAISDWRLTATGTLFNPKWAWVHDVTTEFARDYGKSSPLEDFATAFAAYFMDVMDDSVAAGYTSTGAEVTYGYFGNVDKATWLWNPADVNMRIAEKSAIIEATVDDLSESSHKMNLLGASSVIASSAAGSSSMSSSELGVVPIENPFYQSSRESVRQVRPGFDDGVDSTSDELADSEMVGADAEEDKRVGEAEKPAVVVISDEGQKEAGAKGDVKEDVEPTKDQPALAEKEDRSDSTRQQNKASSFSVEDEKLAAADGGFDLLALDSAFEELGRLALAI